MIEYRYFERFILVVTIILLSTASYDCQFEVNSSHFEVTMNGYQSNLSEPTVSACNVVKHNEEDNEEKDWGFGVALTNDSVVLA
jgi:hypothetical protein